MGTLNKGRGGWTGAGFDVDGRTWNTYLYKYIYSSSESHLFKSEVRSHILFTRYFLFIF